MSDEGRFLFDEHAQAKRRLSLFAAGACGIAAVCMLFGIGQVLELTVQDVWYGVRGDRDPSPQVVIVGIDGKALNAEEERWPWPRDTYLPLIDRLRGAGAKAIGFDLAFSKTTPEDDAFGRAMREAGNVVFGMVFNDAGDRSPPGVTPPSQVVAHRATAARAGRGGGRDRPCGLAAELRRDTTADPHADPAWRRLLPLVRRAGGARLRRCAARGGRSE
jgi:CHASE2 domain-containing sensor protein